MRKWENGHTRFPLPMNILVVDDHPLTCAGLSLLLRSSLPGAQVHGVHAAADARRWLQQEPQADWIFLDIRLPDDPGCTLFDWLRDAGQAQRVILMSAEAPVDGLRYALSQGARGFIPKSLDPDQVLQAFAAIRAGRLFLPPRLQGLAPPASAAAAPASGFSPRKDDVYRLLLKGLPNKAIARELGLSEYTVKEYVSAIFAARGVANRLELLLKDGPPRSLAPSSS